MSRVCRSILTQAVQKSFLKPETAVGKNGASGHSKKSPVKKSREMAHLRQDTTRQKHQIDIDISS